MSSALVCQVVQMFLQHGHGDALALYTSSQGMTMIKSKTFCADAGLGLLESWAVGKEDVVKYHYEFLAYANLTKDAHKTKTYGDGVMQVSAKMFWKRENELLVRVIDKDGIEHRVRIVSVRFCAMRYVNHAGHFTGDITFETKRLTKSGKNNT